MGLEDSFLFSIVFLSKDTNPCKKSIHSYRCVYIWLFFTSLWYILYRKFAEGFSCIRICYNNNNLRFDSFMLVIGNTWAVCHVPLVSVCLQELDFYFCYEKFYITFDTEIKKLKKFQCRGKIISWKSRAYIWNPIWSSEKQPRKPTQAHVMVEIDVLAGNPSFRINCKAATIIFILKPVE